MLDKGEWSKVAPDRNYTDLRGEWWKLVNGSNTTYLCRTEADADTILAALTAQTDARTAVEALRRISAIDHNGGLIAMEMQAEANDALDRIKGTNTPPEAVERA